MFITARRFIAIVAFASLTGCGAKTALREPPPFAVQVALGMAHTCARFSDGSVRCWGDNTYGQLGDETVVSRVEPAAVPGLADVTQISASNLDTCARTRSGAVYCWGANDRGQVGVPSTESTTVSGTFAMRAVLRPTRVDMPAAERVIAAGDKACALLTDGTVRCWGANGSGWFGFYTDPYLRDVPPSEVPGMRDVVALDAEVFEVAILRSGALRFWPTLFCVNCAPGTDLSTIIGSLDGVSDVVDLETGTNTVCARTRAGAVTCWGDPSYEDWGWGWTEDVHTHPWNVPGLDRGVVQLSFGRWTGCVRMEDGSVRCWGENASGQVGDGSYELRREPAVVAGVEGAADVETYSVHSCAVLGGGVVRCWGENGSGQLGDGTRTSSTRPVTVRF